jgi:hypothetical protein
MLVQFYKIMLFACVNALVPNKTVVTTLLPEHQQAYIFQGAMVACRRELRAERLLACTEDASFCTED